MNAARRWTVLLCAAALPLAGCGGPGAAEPSPSPSHSASVKASTKKPAPTAKPHTVRFSITGHGHMKSLTYSVDGKKTTLHSVDVPWKKTVHVPARAGVHTWKLVTKDGSGTFADAVYIDGESYGGSSCSGANCDGDEGGSFEG